jgi:hypothetical protein
MTSTITSSVLLGQLYIAGLRARVAVADLDSIGLALERGCIDAEGARAWLAESGLVGFVTGAST